GSCFHFSCTARLIANKLPSESQVPSAVAEESPGTAITALRILLAEDNLVNQRIGVGLLQKRGHSVTVAGTGIAVLDLLERQIFDLILMDVQMPEMDGFEVVAAIRREEQASGKRTPIIALTAHAMSGDRDRCLAAGMDGYTSKPIREEELN